MRTLPGSHGFELLVGTETVVSGNARLFFETSDSPNANEEGAAMEEGSLAREEVYRELRIRGYDYGPSFQGPYLSAGAEHAVDQCLCVMRSDGVRCTDGRPRCA